MPRDPFLSLSAQYAIFVLMVLFGLVVLYDVWRWYRRPGSLAREQFRRRMLGGALMEVDLGLWLVADMVLARLTPAWMLAYLGIATLLVFVPVLLAIRESAFIARQYVRSRADLVRGLARTREYQENGDARHT